MREFEKKGWYRITIPDGWEVDGDEEPVSIYRTEGAGALQVTAQDPRPLKPGERIDVTLMLRAFLRGTGVDLADTESRRWAEGGLEWAACEYAGDSPEEGTLVWRLWMATNHDLLVFLTYACREEEKALERETVDGMVATLRLT